MVFYVPIWTVIQHIDNKLIWYILIPYKSFLAWFPRSLHIWKTAVWANRK